MTARAGLVLRTFALIAVNGINGESVEDCVRGATAGPVYFKSTQGYSDEIVLETLTVTNFPLAVAHAVSDDDVVALVNCAVKHSIFVTVRSGGHSLAGQSTMDGALCIDVTWMNQTTMSGDLATIQAGATAGSAIYDVFKQSNGTRGVPVGEKPGVGFAGLLLGGGFGFASRQDGLLCDRLVSMKAVTVAGEKIEVSANSHPDLFWASCGGGGGNFVIVTEFTIVTTDVSMGVVAYRCPPAAHINSDYDRLVDVLDWYQDWAIHSGHSMSPNIELMWPEGLLVEGMYRGGLTDFHEMLNRTLGDSAPMNGSDFRSDGDGACAHEGNFIRAAMVNSGMAQYTDPLESVLGRFPGARGYYKFKNWFTYERIPRSVFRLLLEKREPGFGWEIQPLGGEGSAVAEVDPHATAYIHRRARFCLMVAVWVSTRSEYDRLLPVMRKVFDEIDRNLTWRAAYANLQDTDFENYESRYFSVVSDANTEPIVDGTSTLNRLAEVRQRYNPQGLLANVQPNGVRGQDDNAAVVDAARAFIDGGRASYWLAIMAGVLARAL